MIVARYHSPGEVEATALWKLPPADEFETTFAKQRVFGVQSCAGHPHYDASRKMNLGYVPNLELFDSTVGVVLDCEHQGVKA